MANGSYVDISKKSKGLLKVHNVIIRYIQMHSPVHIKLHSIYIHKMKVHTTLTQYHYIAY